MWSAFDVISKPRANYGRTKNFGQDTFGLKAQIDKTDKSFNIEDDKIVLNIKGRTRKMSLGKVENVSLIQLLLEKVYHVNRFDDFLVFMVDAINSKDGLNLFERMSIAEKSSAFKKQAVLFEDFCFRVDFETLDAEKYLRAWNATMESLGEVNIIRASRVDNVTAQEIIDEVRDKTSTMKTDPSQVTDVEPKAPQASSGLEIDPQGSVSVPQAAPEPIPSTPEGNVKVKEIMANAVRDVLRREPELPEDLLEAMLQDLLSDNPTTPVGRREKLASLNAGYAGVVNHIVTNYLNQNFWDQVVLESSRSHVVKQSARDYIKSLNGLLSPLEDLGQMEIAQAASILDAERSKRRGKGKTRNR